MFKDAQRQIAPGLKLPCVPHLGAYNDGDYKLSTILCGIEFVKEPHRLVPDEAFEMLMRRDVDEVEAMVVVYDGQAVRDFLLGAEKPYEMNVLWQPYLFPDLKYREERQCDVECCVLGMHGASVVKDGSSRGLSTSLRTQQQHVGVKDRIYMTMAPDNCTVALNPLLPVCWFWTCVLPSVGHREKGSRFALVTKHIVLNETVSMVTADLRQAMATLTPVSTSQSSHTLGSCCWPSRKQPTRSQRLWRVARRPLTACS